VVQHPELEAIHDRYMTCLRHFTEYNFPAHPNRVQDLLVKLPEVSPSPRIRILPAGCLFFIACSSPFFFLILGGNWASLDIFLSIVCESVKILIKIFIHFERNFNFWVKKGRIKIRILDTKKLLIQAEPDLDPVLEHWPALRGPCIIKLVLKTLRFYS